MTHPVYGFNAGLPGAGLWATARAAIGPFGAWRCYNPIQGVPASWPGTASGPVPQGATMILSSIKVDPASVISGSQDDALKRWVSGAAPGDYPILHHEGENDGFEPQVLIAMHQHAHQVIKQERPDIVYAQIVMAYTASYHSKYAPLEQWIAPGMDVYPIDGYHQMPEQTVDFVWGQAMRAIRKAAGAGAAIAVTECNALAVDKAGYTRAQWFHDSYVWANNHHCKLFLPWYGDPTREPQYQWLAGDTATINELRRSYKVSAS